MKFTLESYGEYIEMLNDRLIAIEENMSAPDGRGYSHLTVCAKLVHATIASIEFHEKRLKRLKEKKRGIH